MATVPSLVLSPATTERPRAASRYYLAPVCGAAWLAGILVASASSLSTGFWLLMAAVATAGAVALWRMGRWGLALAACAAFALGGARYVAARPVIDAGHVAAYNGAAGVELWGQVMAEPQRDDTRQRIRLAARQLYLDGQTLSVGGLLQVETGRYPPIAYGATLHLSGDLLATTSAYDAPYAAYLGRQGIFSAVRYPDVTVVEEGGGSALTRVLLAVRERGRAVLRAALPEPQAALLTGILLGDDSGLPDDLVAAFRATGMTHIIAISGFNIALIIALLDRLTAPLLPRRSATLAIMLLIAAYAALVGASASVVRAAIMGIGYLIGRRFLGRPTLVVATLLATGFLMTLAEPTALWDIGFQLSLAATLGLLLYAEPWLRRLDRATGGMPDATQPVTRQLLGEAFIVTMAAQVLTLPLLLFHFGRLSLVSPVANFLVLPVQPAIMLTGGVTLLAGLLWPVAGRVAALAAWPFLTYTIAIIERLAGLPRASVARDLPSAGLVAVYALIAAVTWFAMLESNRRRKLLEWVRPRVNWMVAILVLGAAAGLVAAWLAQRPDGRLHVVFFDVGQGDAIFIQSPDGRQALVDGGRYPTLVLDALGEQMPFWDRSLDVVIATHPDADHVAGLPEVAGHYEIGRLITNGATADSDPAFAALLAAVGEAAVHPAQAGETIDLGDGARLTILQAGGDGNDGSVVARLEYGDFSLLLPGDAEGAAEESLLAAGQPLASVVLKAGHHGANTSSGEAFLATVAPQVIVISVGADNSYGHPAPAMLARAAAVGAVVLRTDEVGAVEVVSDGGRMWWEVERP